MFTSMRATLCSGAIRGRFRSSSERLKNAVRGIWSASGWTHLTSLYFAVPRSAPFGCGYSGIMPFCETVRSRRYPNTVLKAASRFV
jgi:hypothetical protein